MERQGRVWWEGRELATSVRWSGDASPGGHVRVDSREEEEEEGGRGRKRERAWRFQEQQG